MSKHTPAPSNNHSSGKDRSEGRQMTITLSYVLKLMTELDVPAELGECLTIDELRRLFQRVADREREACAKVCDEYDETDPLGVSLQCAAMIRARGNG